MERKVFASHRIDQRSVHRCLNDLRHVISTLDLARLEGEVLFSLAETIQFYQVEFAKRYPLSFSDARGFVMQLAEQMVHSDVGTFLLCAQGCDWRTTDLFFDEAHRTALQEQLQEKRLPLFDYLLFYVFPGFRATYERFGIFQLQTQRCVADEATFASLPCGRMRDLLTLNYTQLRKPVRLIGIDKDPAALSGARSLEDYTLAPNVQVDVEYRLGDALSTGFTNPPIHEALDLLTSNGLNIYLTEGQCLAFYAHVYQALRPGGVFITSHLVPPSEYRWEAITRGHWQLQVLVWKILINPLWESYLKSRQLVTEQLTQVGFRDVQVIADSQGIFPTFVATKP